NSLITVPVMFQFGIDEKVAIATNMFGLTFMSVGATIPFLRQGKINIGRVSPMIVLTVIGSAIGAMLVGMITNQGIKVIVSVAMIAVALFTLFQRQRANGESHAVSRTSLAIAMTLTFLLAIYGGLYSGGYVTILTAMVVAFFGMTFAEAVASTKLINVFSSSVATIVFAWQGLIDYRLGAILAVTMFVGAYFGAHYATKLNETWLKRIFLTTVLILAIKILYDFASH
ncbi:MAG: sulfite exporter TauE/SafE family protein, partial [Acidobacteriota bacterium]